MEHTVLARQNAGLAHVWTRADWLGDRWSIAQQMSQSLRALYDGLGGGLLADLTVSPRSIDEIISAAPGEIGLPTGSTALIFMPILQLGADHVHDHWVPVVLEPGSGHYRALAEQNFVKKVLAERVRTAFEAAFESLSKHAHCRHEIWVRKNLSAAEQFRETWPDYVPKSGDAPPRPDNLTPAELADRKRRNRPSKEASSKWQVAEDANRADAVAWSQSVVEANRAAREQPKKKR